MVLPCTRASANFHAYVHSLSLSHRYTHSYSRSLSLSLIHTLAHVRNTVLTHDPRVIYLQRCHEASPFIFFYFATNLCSFSQSPQTHTPLPVRKRYNSLLTHSLTHSLTHPLTHSPIHAGSSRIFATRERPHLVFADAVSANQRIHAFILSPYPSHPPPHPPPPFTPSSPSPITMTVIPAYHSSPADATPLTLPSLPLSPPHSLTPITSHPLILTTHPLYTLLGSHVRWRDAGPACTQGGVHGGVQPASLAGQHAQHSRTQPCVFTP